MSGRKGLVAVTVLTVFTMLLGGGALNAFAAEQGGRGHGGDERGAAAGQPQLSPALVVASPVTTQEQKKEQQQVPPGLSSAHADEGLHLGQTREHEDEGLHEGDGWGNIIRQDQDDEDLVTPPVRVTDTPRPCGECRVETPKQHGDDQDDAAEMEDSGGDD